MTLDQCRRVCAAHGASFTKRANSDSYDVIGDAVDANGVLISIPWNNEPITFNLHGHVWSETIRSALGY